MANITTTSELLTTDNNSNQGYGFAMVAMTTLFFLWGFITVLNDILIPQLKSAFELNYTQAMLIQFCFFGAYFITSIPAGALVKRIGYKNGVIAGLAVGSIGCLMFYPAASIHQYWLFLCALFVLASGITILQVSANPYVAALGPEKTASSRLNLAQALNSLGTTIAPSIGGVLFFSATATFAVEAASAESVKVPYLMLAIFMVLIALVFFLLKLPKLSIEQASNASDTEKRPIWHAKHTVFGAVAIFFYVGAEVSIGSFIVNYLSGDSIAGMSEKSAAKMLTYYWGGAMVGRFIGAYLMRYISAQIMLTFNCIAIAMLLITTMYSTGNIAVWSLLAVGLFNSIMFPTIFTLAIDNLKELTSKGSGLLCLAIVGGAIIPIIQGGIADSYNIQSSFWIPLSCYLFIFWYAKNVHSLKNSWQQSKLNKST